MNQHKTHGFTIVELLIVIVILGILAAIVIVAYNGIQVQARNSKTTSVIQAYKKALLEYATINRAYPATGSSCLGDDYPDDGAFTAAANRSCFRSNSTGIINTTFNSKLLPFMGGSSLPTPNNKIYGDGASPWAIRGAIMHTSTGTIINGTANPWILIYTLEGQTKCSVGPALDTTGYPNISGGAAASGYTALISGGTPGVECWVAMPDPAKI